MSLISKLGGLFTGATVERAVETRVALVNGTEQLLSREELAGLERLAASGMIRRDVTDAMLGTGNFTQGIPAFWFARSVEGGLASGNKLTTPYQSSAWVQRAIKLISGPISSLRLVFLESSAADGQKGLKTERARRRRIYTMGGIRRLAPEGDPEELDLPEVRQWLARPMKGLGWSDFVEASIGWLKLQECFWLLGDDTLRPFKGAPAKKGGGASPYSPIIVARPRDMRAVIERGELVGWVWTGPQGRQEELLPEQVVQLRYWDPDNLYRSSGEYPSAMLAAEGDYLAASFQRNLMACNGDLGGVVIAKSGVPTDPQREQIIMDLRAKRAAQLRGELKYVFLTGDIDIKDPKITSVDQPFISQRLENRHEVAIAFGVPPSLFDVKASYSIGSASDLYQLVQNTCIPTGQKFCDGLERLIFTQTGQQVAVGLEWDDNPTLQAVRRERLETAKTLWGLGMPMEAINDYLALDIEPYDGWEVGYLPINVVPAAEASEPEPAPGKDDSLSEQKETKETKEEGESAEAEGGETAATQEAEKEKGGPVREAVEAVRARMGQKADANHKLWEAHMRARSGTVRAYTSKVRRVVNEFRVKALKQLSAAHGKALAEEGPFVARGLVDIIFNATNFGVELVKHLNPITAAAIETAAEQVRSEIGAVDPWKFPPAKVLEFVDSREQPIKGCGQTARDELNTSLKEGIEGGESLEELEARVKGVFSGLAKGEARRIAVTETGMAFSFGRHETMVAANVPYKAWLSSHGPTVRPAHAAAEETYLDDPIPVDEPFIVDGEELMHPGDPDGSPGNVINCQCVELARMKPE